MTLAEYLIAARRTRRNGTSAAHLATAALGLCGEAGELHTALSSNPDKIAEEAGDWLWYAASIMDECQTATSEWTNETLTEQALEMALRRQKAQITAEGVVAALLVQCCMVADAVKKVTAQGHVLDEFALAEDLRLAIMLVIDIVAWHGHSLSDLMDKNDQKLRARYPDGFSVKASIDRDKNPTP